MNLIRPWIVRVNNFQVRVLAGLTTRKLLPFIESGQSVLDIGCGLGYQAKDIAKKKSVQVSGIDVIDYTDSDFSCKIFDGTHIPFPDKSFDVSYLAYVLHHAQNPIKLLSDALRVTKKRILILEDTPRTPFDRLLDAYHGWSFNKFYHLSHASVFRSQEAWENIFKQFPGISYKSYRLGRLEREFYFPIARTLFVIEKLS